MSRANKWGSGSVAPSHPKHRGLVAEPLVLGDIYNFLIKMT